MYSVYSGKGSPEAIAVALHLVAKYKLYDKKFRENAALGIENYCESYIGLDCNGFVFNYAQAIGLTSKKVDTSIESYALPPRARRAELEEVQPNDVLVASDFGHINIIDSVHGITTGPDGKQALRCTVVESTASNVSKEAKAANGGLQNSVYSLRKAGRDKLFNTERPKGSRPMGDVYIAPLA